MSKYEEGFKEITAENYTVAKRKLQELLKNKPSPKSEFDARYGLAVCHFHLHEWDDAIAQANKATEIFDDHFDIHIILAQCYATKFFMTRDEKFRTSARKEYEKSGKLATKRPGKEPEELEERIKQLKKSLEENNGISPIYN